MVSEKMKQLLVNNNHNNIYTGLQWCRIQRCCTLHFVTIWTC